jgi:MFS family permease
MTHTKHLRRRGGLVSQSPIYYGWIVLLVGTLGLIMTSPGQTYGVSPFVEHFIADLSISRTLTSALFAVGPLVGSLALPFIGRQIDRRGSRQMVVVIVAGLGLACLAMAYVQNTVMLCLGFVALRTFGKGGLELVSVNVINQWWVRRRGMAMGVAGLGMALLGFGAFPSVIHWLISIDGWRPTYIALGLLLFLVMLPMGYLLFRDHPEDYGLGPDGCGVSDSDVPEAGDRDASEVAPEENWTAQEAIRTWAFWILTIGIGFIILMGAGLFFHIVRIFEDNGLSGAVAAAVFVPVGLTMAVISLISGILVDHVPVRFLLVIALASQALSLVMIQFVQSVAFAMAYGVLLGVTGGLMRTVRGVAWANYFGRRHLGSIMGIASPVLIGGSALGPMPLGVARDLFGSYHTTLAFMAFIPLVLAVASLSAKQPLRRPEAS